MYKFIILLFCLIPSLTNAQQNEIPIYTSPIVNGDKTVIFNIYAPKATSVSLTGTIQSDDIPLTKTESGLWTVTIGPLAPEIYHYQFYIDGAKVTDIKNQNPYPWLEGKSELIVPGNPPLLHELTDIAHGTLHNHIYHSTTTKGPNTVRVYTPPNYDPGDQKHYPVLFLLHGFGEKVAFWSDFGKINLITDNLIAQNKIIEPIIVMPNGDPLEGEYYKFFNSKTDGPAWMRKNIDLLEKDLINDLIPFLKTQYKIKSEKVSMAIAGSSMGGTQAVILGTRNLDQFGWIIGLTAGFDIPPFGIENKEQINSLKLFQFNIGRDDKWGFDQSKKVHEWLTEKGVKHEWLVSDGGHEWDVWRKNMALLLPKLFR